LRFIEGAVADACGGSDCARWVEQAGAEWDLVAGENIDLPLYRDVEDDSIPGRVADLLRLAESADAFIWASPEYHGGESGVLKNALDWLPGTAFRGKPVGLIGVAGGEGGAFGTLHSLRAVARTVYAWAIPAQVSVASSDDAFDDDDRPLNPHLEERLKDLGREVVEASRLLRAKKR